MDVNLPTGAVLNITPAPFSDAKALWQTLLEEARGVRMDDKADIDANLFKDLFCAAFGSKKVEAALWVCFKRCTYDAVDGKGPLRIDGDTFEPEKAREDYLQVCFEVTRANCLPFFKTLASRYREILGALVGAVRT